MPALLAAMIVGFCLAASAPMAGADGACPGTDASSPRFCAQSGMTDHALVVVASVVPVAPEPEPASCLPISRAEAPGIRDHAVASPPRAPPALS